MRPGFRGGRRSAKSTARKATWGVGTWSADKKWGAPTDRGKDNMARWGAHYMGSDHAKWDPTVEAPSGFQQDKQKTRWNSGEWNNPRFKW